MDEGRVTDNAYDLSVTNFAESAAHTDACTHAKRRVNGAKIYAECVTAYIPDIHSCIFEYSS